MAEQTDQQKQQYREFIELLPLTLELAGLPRSEPGKYFTAEQIDARVFTVKHAFDAARQMARDAAEE